ncbi:NAD(P)-binding protein, partial [Fusarium austroafricanum]
MAIIALAGATGRVGKTIAEVLSTNPKHSFMILSRKEPENGGNFGTVHKVDYNDAASLLRVLEKHKIDTVISTILVKDDESSASEVALVKAAARSSTTKRFIASDYAAPIPRSKRFGRLLARQATIDELQNTDLEWTTVRNGQFADNLGIPHLKSYMIPMAPNVDMANQMAAVPGTGDDPIAYSYSFDIVKFVVAALDLHKWDRDLFCYSDSDTEPTCRDSRKGP